MIRKLFVCILMFAIVCALSGCGSQSELKEEDMVNAESVLQKGIPNDYGDAPFAYISQHYDISIRLLCK